MAQIAQIVMAILGLTGVVSIQAVCWTFLGCEVIRIIAEFIKARYSRH